MEMDKSTFEVLSMVANWIAAIANVTLFILGYRTLRRDRQRILKIESAERQKYAEDMFVWIEKRTASNVEVFCKNGSASAMYDVRVLLVDQQGTKVSDVYQIDLMKPTEERSFEMSYAGSPECSAVVQFRDVRGSMWVRNETGSLVELSDEDPRYIAEGRRPKSIGD